MNKPEMSKIINLKRDIRFEATKDDEYNLYVYGFIGSWRNSPERILETIQNTDAKTIHVHINSEGGSAFDGVAIGNILKQHDAEIIVYVDGWAASAASVIAMAGDKIIMPSNTMMMIHQASTFGYGNANQFEKVAKDLRKIDTALRASYKNRFVGDEADLIKLLEEETWLTAEEALALGFADEIVDEIEIDDTQEDEEEVINHKDQIVAKYTKNNKSKEKEPEQEPVVKQNLSRLFL